MPNSNRNNVFTAALLNDTDGRTNIGCRLTSQTLKNSLHCAFKKSNCQLIISSAPWLFNKRKRDIAKAWRNQKNIFSKAIQANSCFSNKPFTKWLTQLAKAEYGKKSMRLALKADAVFFQPEGALGDDSNFQQIAGFLSLPLLCIIHGKKVICLNGTIPNYTDARRQLVEFLFQNCIFASSRDRLTSEFYHTDFSPDAALAYQINVKPTPDRDKLLISTGARNTPDEDIFIIDYALKYAEKSGLKPLVLTKSFRRFESRKQQVEAMGGEFLTNLSLAEAEEKLKDAALHIGGRYHMAIFALLFGTPTLLYEIRTHKNVWLSEDFEEISLFSQATNDFSTADNLLEKARAASWTPSQALTEMNRQYHDIIDSVSEKLIHSSHLRLQSLFSNN